jgi:metal-responsive CopG/Arc/MetJ family transcriptional regulator
VKSISISFNKKSLILLINFNLHPTNNCLDVAIISAPEKRTQKTINKLKTVAGRFFKK